MNRENLQRMADYIRTIPQEKFDMTHFRVDAFIITPECDSVGCVIGHCTILDSENFMKNYIVAEDGELEEMDFLRWSEDFTGLRRAAEWYWCFSSYWKMSDNTPEGAAKRIEYLLKNGLPKNWSDSMYGYEIKPY